MTRLPDWPTRLLALIEKRRSTPFQWGLHDCALFAADCILAQTGHDPAAAFRDRYTTERGALRVLRREGFRTLVAAVTDRLGAPVPPAFAQRGGVVRYRTQAGGTALAVCLGAFALAPGAQGLDVVPTDRWVEAWNL